MLRCGMPGQGRPQRLAACAIIHASVSSQGASCSCRNTCVQLCPGQRLRNFAVFLFLKTERAASAGPERAQMDLCRPQKQEEVTAKFLRVQRPCCCDVLATRALALASHCSVSPSNMMHAA